MGYTTDFRGQFGLTEMVYKLLDAIYVEYPEGVSTMPDRLSEAAINILIQLAVNSKICDSIVIYFWI